MRIFNATWLVPTGGDNPERPAGGKLRDTQYTQIQAGLHGDAYCDSKHAMSNHSRAARATRRGTRLARSPAARLPVVLFSVQRPVHRVPSTVRFAPRRRWFE